MKQVLRNNGLAIAFLLLFLMSLIGQAGTGYKEYNKEREEENQQPVSSVVER